MKALALIVALMFFSKIHSMDAQTNASADSQTPGVSVSFLRFIDTGQPHTSTNGFWIAPVTNWSLFGARTSSPLGVTNITVTNYYSGGPAAVFQYRSASQYPTVLMLQSVEYDTGGVWKKIAIPADAQSMLLASPYATVTQTIPVTATNVVWRITTFCIEQASGVARVVERAELLGTQAITGQKTDRFTGRGYFLKTNSPPLK